MKLNKNLIKISILLSMSTFIISLILVINNLCTHNDMVNYWINVALAIFGSSVVMLFTSIWGYFSERKRYEIQYAAFARDFLLRTSRFLNLYNNKNVNAKEVYTIAGDLHSFYDSFSYEKDFEIYGYFLKYSKRKLKMKKIHDTAFTYSKELSRIEFLAQESFNNNKDDFIFQSSIVPRTLDSSYKLIIELFNDN